MKESFVLIENESSLKIGNNNRLFCTVWVRFRGRPSENLIREANN